MFQDNSMKKNPLISNYIEKFNDYLNFLLHDDKNMELEIIKNYLNTMNDETLTFHKLLFITNNEKSRFPNINISIKTFMSFNFLDELFFKFYIYHINLKLKKTNDKEEEKFIEEEEKFINYYELNEISYLANSIQYFFSYDNDKLLLEEILNLLIEKFEIYKKICQENDLLYVIDPSQNYGEKEDNSNQNYSEEEEEDDPSQYYGKKEDKPNQNYSEEEEEDDPSQYYGEEEAW